MMLGTVCPPLSPSFFSKLEFPIPSVSPSTSSSSSSLLSRSSRASSLSSPWTHSSSLLLPAPSPHISSSPILRRPVDIVLCRATAEYKFPDPIPEFADAETDKFRAHLMKKLSKKDMFGDSIDEVVGICTEIFSTFLHSEYGGPGTLLVIPFIDMADTINERGLPGGPQAARAAVKWAQKHVDKDWNEWNVEGSS